MYIKTSIRKNEYKDSVQLMQAASSAMNINGVDTASLMMGTDNNKDILKESKLLTNEAKQASANDIIISIRAKNSDIADQAFKIILEILDKEEIIDEQSEKTYKSTRSAIEALPEMNLVAISVPGEYAAREAKVALEAGKNVFLFSDNVSIEEEIALKTLAKEKGLIVMGPDCGTAIIKGIGIGFANVVRQGSIGIVAASGTGLQEVSSLIHLRGRGVSHAIGTGGRDVKDSIGGLAVISGLDALAEDPDTKVIIIVSKPPQQKTMENILKHAKTIKKPIVVNFLGADGKAIEKFGFTNAATLESASYIACALDLDEDISKYQDWVFDDPKEKILQRAEQEYKELSDQQQYVRGLYAGGTFTSEAVILLSILLEGEFYSNVSGGKELVDLNKSTKHTIIDLGDDVFTVGKPHPMIDQTYRKKRVLQEAQDPETAVILLDFVLGYGSHMDPVGDMEEVLNKIRSQNQYIPIVAHICGTDIDPQDYKNSFKILEKFNVISMPTNAQAVRMAALIASRGKTILWKEKL